MYDVVALGELLIDFTPCGINDRELPVYQANPGGAPCNVLSMLSRLGRKTSFIGKVGHDMFGKMLRRTLQEEGIGDSGLVSSREVNTTLAFVQIDEHGDREFSFYRNPGADMKLTAGEVALELVEHARVFHFGTISMTHDDVRRATRHAVSQARKKGALISFDPNLRPALWENDEMMRKVLNDLANYADVVLPGIGECEILAGTTDKEKAADFYHQKGAALVVIKDGKNGAYVSEKKENGEVVRDMIPGYPVKKVVDTVGAGDGFAVGVLSGLLKGLPVTECAKRGNAIGSIQVQHRGDNEGLPTEEILQSYMAGNIQK